MQKSLKERIYFIAAIISIPSATVTVINYFWPLHVDQFFKIGHDSVAIGHIPDNSQIGDNSVIIGATDSKGNVILDKPMAIGRNAEAGNDSIAIGSSARAGVEK